ncbi:phosphorylase family protein [Natrarchaeobius chitinivorans]|uniref:Phosphorylase n=1 Tax=Natrarchaeobius chitinivorans TaxID=1679083 RepID=A0A3N6M772_NATCH|nr:phosphorylase [Natrarchaeobius chitinivorans]RQG91980.1 phosphorylase [Natrarchaeobius chitinivorans]
MNDDRRTDDESAGDDRPATRPLDPADPVRPTALVLPAAAEAPLDERRPWLERVELEDVYAVPGTDTSLYLTTDGVAITTTGIGKSDAATTVAALLANSAIDLESAYVVSCGIAGSSPQTTALGSVILADAVVDWDRKHRWDRGTDADGEDRSADTNAEPRSIDLLSYRPRDYVHQLDDRVLETGLRGARAVSLVENDETLEYQCRYPNAPETGPIVGAGTTVCGDEFWHGAGYAREVEYLCERYGVGPYVTTQMEDAATATALDRFDCLDRYLSVRAVSNYDRPSPGESVEESFDGNDASLALAIENAARVGSGVVDTLVTDDPLGLQS